MTYLALARSALQSFQKLTDTSFATKMKAVERCKVVAESAAQKLQRRHVARLAHMKKLGEMAEQIRAMSSDSFAEVLETADPDYAEAQSFALNATLLAHAKASLALPWAVFMKELETTGAKERHGALQRPHAFFEELHERQLRKQEQ